MKHELPDNHGEILPNKLGLKTLQEIGLWELLKV